MAFAGLSQLQSLNLSGNRLASLGPQVFRDTFPQPSANFQMLDLTGANEGNLFKNKLFCPFRKSSGLRCRQDWLAVGSAGQRSFEGQMCGTGAATPCSAGRVWPTRFFLVEGIVKRIVGEEDSEYYN